MKVATTEEIAKNQIRSALSEGSIDSALSELEKTCSINAFRDCVKVLLKEFEAREDLLIQFLNHKSDAHNLEATDQEKLENDFKEWFYTYKY